MEKLEELRQENEALLTALESEFLQALLTGDWGKFDEFIQSIKEESNGL